MRRVYKIEASKVQAGPPSYKTEGPRAVHHTVVSERPPLNLYPTGLPRNGTHWTTSLEPPPLWKTIDPPPLVAQFSFNFGFLPSRLPGQIWRYLLAIYFGQKLSLPRRKDI